jgi:hypothetical protein
MVAYAYHSSSAGGMGRKFTVHPSPRQKGIRAYLKNNYSKKELSI